MIQAIIEATVNTVQAAVVVLIQAFPVWLLWNALIPLLFPEAVNQEFIAGEISYWTAVLLVLFVTLFGYANSTYYKPKHIDHA